MGIGGPGGIYPVSTSIVYRFHWPRDMAARVDGRRLADRDDTFRLVAVTGVLSALGSLGLYVLGLHGHFPLPLDAKGVPLGRDFVNTWFYGRAFFDHDPGLFYNRTIYERAVQAILPQNDVAHLWSYPPPFLLVAAPFGLLSYPAALAAWTLCGLITLGLAVRAQGSLWLTVAVLTSPLAIFSILAGQVSLALAALTLIVFTQLDRRPMLAGLLLSIFVMKPQAIALVPVLLIASGRWTVLLFAAIGALAIVAISIAANGLDTWIQFVRDGLPAQAAELKDSIFNLMPISPTVTTEAIQAGLPPIGVTCLQVAATLGAVAVVAFVGWRGNSEGRTSAHYEGLVVLTCSVLATPYMLIHDLLPLSTMLLIVGFREGLFKHRIALLVILYTPILQIGLAALHIHVMALLILALACWLVMRITPFDRSGGLSPDRALQAFP